MRVTYGKSVHGNDEIKAVVKVLKDSTQMGKNVRLLESKIAKLFEKKYGVMFNSASSALMIAMEIINLPKGSEVITPALNFGTAVTSIIKAGLVPKFVDINLKTFCTDADYIQKAITKKTKALCIPNLIGNLPNWPEIKKIAKKNNLIIIEDSADTLGSKIDDNFSGKYADISVTSFYGSHIINGAGNGGMLCVDNKKYFEKALMLRSWGRSSSLFFDKSEKIENRFNIKLDGIDYDKKFIFEVQGYNLEPSEISAAFALVQLKKLKINISQRHKNYLTHLNFFKKYENFFILPEMIKSVRTAFLAFPIIIKKNMYFNRKEFQIFLEKKNIQTRVIFTGNILRQPGFSDYKRFYKKDSFLNADVVMRGGVLLGMHQGLNKNNLKYVHKIISNFLKPFNI